MNLAVKKLGKPEGKSLRSNVKPSFASAKTRLTFRSLFMHAWDFADGEIDRTMAWVRDAGLNTICFAGTYHSGWFLHPHHPKHRAFMTEGSVSYFRPQNSLWKNVKLRLQPSKLCAKENPLTEIGKRLKKFDLRLVSWTIGCHNSRLGQLHPNLTQQNVYGDRLPHALCPAQPEVREFLLTLCRDLAMNYPLFGIQLEAFDWMNFAHGHHHERDLIGLTPFEQELMSMCVCPACFDAASQANVDVATLCENVKSTLDSVFREAPDRPKNHPRSMAEFETTFPEAKKFNAWRKKSLHSLIASIKCEALSGCDCRLLLQSGFDQELSKVADGFACGAYGKTPAETLALCQNMMRSDWKGSVQCFVRLGMGIPSSEEQLRLIIQAVEKGGCNGINFYNYSESPPKMLGWLKNVLPK